MEVRRAFVVVGLLIAAAVAVVTVRPAFADSRDISVGGIWITRITHDSAGVSSYDRAVQINIRITQVLSSPKYQQGAVISVQPYGTAATITVGDILVFTVTPDDAAGTSMTPMQIARQWASLLAKGLSNAMPGSVFHF